MEEERIKKKKRGRRSRGIEEEKMEEYKEMRET